MPDIKLTLPAGTVECSWAGPGSPIVETPRGATPEGERITVHVTAAAGTDTSLIMEPPMPDPTPDYSARLAWARRHDPQLWDRVNRARVNTLRIHAGEDEDAELDALLSTLDQRYREAHAGSPERWGHAELVAEVVRLRAALGRSCERLAVIIEGECASLSANVPEYVEWRAMADGRPAPVAMTTFECRTCSRYTEGEARPDGFAVAGWSAIDGIDGPNGICPTCVADPTSLDSLREDGYPNARVRAIAEGRR